MPEFTLLIRANELADRLGDERLRVVDCRFDLAAPERGREAYRAGHIRGAVYADLDRDLAAPVTAGSGRHPLPAPAEFATTLERLGIDNDSQVVVYDGGNGAFAARAWWMLRWVGHDRVAVLDGGFAGWIAAGHPAETGEITAAPGRFRPAPRPERVTTTAEIAAAVDAGRSLMLVDARDARRFRGIAEPIDAVSGHIPGALNFPLGDSLRPDGHWKTPASLAAAWRRLLGDAPGGPWTVMCGSGVTACHLALSGRLAGYQEPTVYAGSWSEWIRDPGRPVATGTGDVDAEPAAT